MGLASEAADLGQRIRLVNLGAAHHERLDRIGQVLADAELDLVAAMRPFWPAANGFTSNVSVATLGEACVRSQLGLALWLDVVERAAPRLTEQTSEALLGGDVERATIDLVGELLGELRAADPELDSRLRLVGRRMAGELVAQGQRIAVQHDELAALVGGGAAGELDSLAGIGELLSNLLAAHAERMTELGL